MCAEDAAVSGKDAAMCGKDAAMCAKVASMWAEVASACAKVLNVRHNDAKTMRKPCESETWSSFGVAESLPTTAACLANTWNYTRRAWKGLGCAVLEEARRKGSSSHYQRMRSVASSARIVVAAGGRAPIPHVPRRRVYYR